MAPPFMVVFVVLTTQHPQGGSVNYFLPLQFGAAEWALSTVDKYMLVLCGDVPRLTVSCSTRALSFARGGRRHFHRLAGHWLWFRR